MLKYVFLIISVSLSLTVWGCSNQKNQNQQTISRDKAAQTTNKSGLSTFQMKNGIGPIKKEVKVGPLDEELAEKGKGIFENECTACHKIGKRYVGPDLEDVTSRRTPAYIMNMILNPEEMTQKHPVAHKLLENFATQMANRQLTREQARAVLEYLRSVNSSSKK